MKILGTLPAKGKTEDTINFWKQQKELRKSVRLPATKSLVYYYSPSDPSSKIDIDAIEIDKEYTYTVRNGAIDIEEKWYSLRITLCDGVVKLIHNDYLGEMQRPHFCEEYIRTQKDANL